MEYQEILSPDNDDENNNEHKKTKWYPILLNYKTPIIIWCIIIATLFFIYKIATA